MRNLLLLLLSFSLIASSLSTEVFRIHPFSGPTSGGTVLSVWGSDFISGEEGTVCYWQGEDFGASSDVTANINSSYLECTLPAVEQLANFRRISADRTHVVVDFFITYNQTFSNKLTFTLFNLSTLSVTDLTPLEGLYTQAHALNFSLSSLNYTRELACIFLQKVYPVTSISSGARYNVMCEIPSVPSPRRELVQLSLNGDTSGIIGASVGTSLVFTFCHSAPQVAVSYSPSLTRLHLDFDREVEIGGRDQASAQLSPVCDKLFTADTLGFLGTDAVCSWDNYQLRRLVIELTRLISLQAHTQIVYSSAQSFRTRYTMYSYLLEGSSPILQDSSPPLPVLFTYTHIPICGDVVFSAVSSQMGGTQDLEATWAVSASNGQATSLPALVSQFSSQTGLEWSLPVTLFHSAVTYIVNLTLSNFLSNSAAISVSLTQSPADLPSSTIHYSIPGTHYTHRDLLILAVLEVPSCLPLAPTPLSFSWSLDNPVTSLPHSNLPLLLLPANSLASPGEYQIVYTLSNGSSSLSSLFALPLSLAGPVARVLGADRRTHFLGEDLVLDGTASFDYSQHPLTYKWTCMDIDRAAPCTDNNGDNLLAQDSNRLYVFQQSLLTESILRFSLTVTTTDGRTSADTLLTVDIRSSRPDLVYLISPPYPRIPVSPNIPIRVTGWVRSPSDQYVLSLSTISGVMEDQQYYDYSQNLNVTSSQFSSSPPYSLPSDSAPLLTSQPSQFSFHIPSAFLRTGQRYRLLVTLSTQEGATTASAEMDIQLDYPPHLGTLTVTSSVRSDGVKVYSLLASQWRDSPTALPLKYRFGIRLAGEAGVHWLTPSTTLPQLETPLLCSFNAELPLVLRVENSYGSAVYYPAQLQISAHTDVTGALGEVRDKLVYGYSVVSGLSIVSSILYFYESEGNLMPPETAATLWEHLSTAYRSLLSKDRSLSSHAIFLTAKLVLQTHTLTEAQLLQVLGLLRDALAYVSECPPADVPFDRGVSPKLFNVTFAAIAKLNTSGLMAWHRLPGVLTRLAASTRNSLNPEIVSLSMGHISLKVSHTSLPERYYAVCNAREQDCTGSLPLVHFSETAFHNYHNWDCFDTDCSVGSSGFESVRCFGVIIVTSQINKHSFPLPTAYSPRLVSNILTLSLLHPSTYEDRGVTGVTVTLLTDPYDSVSTYSCTLWDADTLTWDTALCSTLSRDSTTVECQCGTSGTVSVLSICPPGRYGPQCTSFCPLGLWGDQCSQSCNCSVNSTCSPINGFCDCAAGYTGSSCDTVCTDWTYGSFCSDECGCHKPHSYSCDPVHGVCDCKPGFRGERCAVTCNRGTWGYKCAGECQCQSTGLCDYFDGSCICQAGFEGVHCGTPCSEWSYGSNCSSNCSCVRESTAACSSIDGVCECNSTHTGANCSTVIVLTADPFPIEILAGVSVVIVIVFLIILIFLVIIVVICCKRWKRRAVAISPEKEPLYFRSESDSLSRDRFSPVSKLQVHYNEFVSTKVDSLVAIPLRVSSDSMLGEDSWYFIEVVVVVAKETWRPYSQKGQSPQAMEMETAFQAPERPEIGILSLSGQFSLESKTDTFFERFSDPVLLPRGDNTLIDLREAFVDSGLWPGGPFLYLKKDIAYTFISLASEEYELSDLTDNNIYIQRVRDVDEVMLELCVCGKVSNFECSLCGERGYCGEECQSRDWEAHMPICSKAQKKNNDHNISLGATMEASMDRSFFEDSALPGDLKLTLSSRLEQIGETELEEEEVLPPLPITHVRQKRSLPEQEDQPLSKSDHMLLDENPGTDEVVYFDIHEGRRRRSPTELEQGGTKVDT